MKFRKRTLNSRRILGFAVLGGNIPTQQLTKYSGLVALANLLLFPSGGMLDGPKGAAKTKASSRKA